MVKKRFSPEEKLLRMIEKPAGQEMSVDRELRKQKAGMARKRWFFSFKSMQLNGLLINRPNFTLQFINKLLIVTAFFLTLFFIADFIRDKVYLKRDFILATTVPQLIKKKENKKVIPSANLAVLLGAAKKRNLFTLTPRIERGNRKDETVLRDEITDLKLVGILWSNIPQVMIEDVKVGKTYSVGVNGAIKGWVVKEIQRDKVILLSDEGENELR